MGSSEVGKRERQGEGGTCSDLSGAQAVPESAVGLCPRT